SEKSTFSGRDFGPEVTREIISHLQGLDSLERPLASPAEVRDISLLHLAAVSGNTEVAAHLIRSGADLGARTSTGATPLEIAYALWIYTWDDEVWDRDYRFENPRFLDFMRLMLLHGQSPQEIQRDYAEHPEVYERIFVRHCRDYRLTDAAGSGGEATLEEVFARRFASGAWSLRSFDVLDSRARHLCTIVVEFEGVLREDGARLRIPLVYMDNILLVAGTRMKDMGYPMHRNGRRVSVPAARRFWESLGLAVEDPDIGADEAE
ncbi:MAG: hypothetical protein Q4F72_11745, partial [Desulfovibrionaceae bacterium]|nr:hypothetical protein [Desulfovibrionaceae bacterium]